MKKYFLIGIILITGLMFYSLLSEENIHDLEGGFEQTAYVRNENNTGPIVRIYAFTLNDSLWQNMEKHGNLMPHTKYGTTEVYYFLKNQQAPSSLNLKDSRFDEQYQQYCIAKFTKDGQGRATLLRHPFGQ
ncbi:hypothetical protein JKA74_00205 [Marivirga sp. S37H4]|uniref:Uncharacterized protein n=1 Tax=Marivirga aurantiaca TaxID=2802615 RepID=A0A934WUZ5_9BACT|nr:hypothetical protein [Marivirga aurantiaca]MBK6263437.1 hypothetical protein [Marivirga aurantiaca]